MTDSVPPSLMTIVGFLAGDTSDPDLVAAAVETLLSESPEALAALRRAALGDDTPATARLGLARRGWYWLGEQGRRARLSAHRVPEDVLLGGWALVDMAVPSTRMAVTQPPGRIVIETEIPDDVGRLRVGIDPEYQAVQHRWVWRVNVERVNDETGPPTLGALADGHGGRTGFRTLEAGVPVEFTVPPPGDADIVVHVEWRRAAGDWDAIALALPVGVVEQETNDE